MKEVEQLEAAVGSKVEQWNADSMNVLTEEDNQPLLQLFKNPIVLNECMLRSKGNREVEDILYPLSVKLLLDNSEKMGNDILKNLEEKKITEDEVIKRCEALLANESFYQHLVAYIILISKCPSYDLKTKEHDIKNDISQIKEIICTFGSKDTIVSLSMLVYDLLELVSPLRKIYFEKYQVDILDDSDKRLQSVIDLVQGLFQDAMKASSEIEPTEDPKEETQKGGDEKK